MSAARSRGAELRSPHELTDTHLKCRLKSHSWDEIPDDGRRAKDWKSSGTERHLFRCTNCGTHALELWVRATGELFKRYYEYPQGYKLSRDASGERFVRADIRWEVMQRNKRQPKKSNGRKAA